MFKDNEIPNKVKLRVHIPKGFHFWPLMTHTFVKNQSNERKKFLNIHNSLRYSPLRGSKLEREN